MEGKLCSCLLCAEKKMCGSYWKLCAVVYFVQLFSVCFFLFKGNEICDNVKMEGELFAFVYILEEKCVVTCKEKENSMW